MSSHIINWRFGYIILQVGKWYITIKPSLYWKENKPKNWFERY